MSEQSKEITTINAPKLWSDDQLAELNTWADLESAIAARGDVQAYSITDFGTGFALLDDKSKLVDEEFIIVDWRFSIGDHGEFVSALVMTRDNRKFVINDGSAGICRQIADAERKRGKGVIHVPRGLTKSEYMYESINPKTGEAERKPATTYYLSTSK